jgi:hypothetical protein
MNPCKLKICVSFHIERIIKLCGICAMCENVCLGEIVDFPYVSKNTLNTPCFSYGDVERGASAHCAVC